MPVCVFCKKEVTDLRLGCCFDCAHDGERNAAKRSVWEHIKTGFGNLWKRNFLYAKYDFQWAFERLTLTGDYKAGGYFDSEGHEWR